MNKILSGLFAAIVSISSLWAFWVLQAGSDIPGCSCGIYGKPTQEDTFVVNKLMTEVLKDPDGYTGEPLSTKECESLFRYHREDPGLLSRLYLLKVIDLSTSSDPARRPSLEKDIRIIIAMAVKPNGVPPILPLGLLILASFVLCLSLLDYSQD